MQQCTLHMYAYTAKNRINSLPLKEDSQSTNHCVTRLTKAHDSQGIGEIFHQSSAKVKKVDFLVECSQHNLITTEGD